MSTNYYAVIHLGKTSGQGNGKPLLFIQAADGYTINALRNEKIPVVVTDVLPEGEDFNSFIERVDSMDWDYDHIGEEFR